MAIVWVSVAVTLPTASDPDLWGHIRFGQQALLDGAIQRVDPYSFTSDRPWINHEWLAEALMASTFNAAGSLGLLALKGGMLFLTMGLAVRLLWQPSPRPLPPLAALLFVGLAGVFPLMATFRPQVFSVVLMVVQLSVQLVALSRPSMLWILPPVFALWANLHGGWLVGLGVLGVWTAARLADNQVRSPERRLIVAVVASSIAATLLTPYGFELWRFLWSTVGLARPDIPEWWSIVAHPVLAVPWAAACAVGAWAARRAGRPGIPAAVVALALAVLSARVARLIPFFSLSVGIGLMPVALGALRTGHQRHLFRWHLAIVTIGSVLAVGQDLLRASPLTCLQPASVLTLDPQAGRFVQANSLQGKLVVWFDWGQYAIWHFGPQLQVSMDGRRETVYSADTLARHVEFYGGGDAARQYLSELAPDYVWLPRALPVSGEIDSWGYRPIFEGEKSIIWTPKADRRAYAPPGSQLPGCFPGP